MSESHKHITGGVEEDRPVLDAHLRRDHGVEPGMLVDPAEWHREAHRKARLLPTVRALVADELRAAADKSDKIEGDGQDTLARANEPPPFDPDPDLIDHLEGNERMIRRYRRRAEQMRDDQ